MRIGRSQRFDQARPFVVLGVALAAWVLAPVAVRTFTRASFFEMTAPVAAAASYASDVQQFWALKLHSKDELIEAGLGAEGGEGIGHEFAIDALLVGGNEDDELHAVVEAPLPAALEDGLPDVEVFAAEGVEVAVGQQVVMAGGIVEPAVFPDDDLRVLVDGEGAMDGEGADEGVAEAEMIAVGDHHEL